MTMKVCWLFEINQLNFKVYSMPRKSFDGELGVVVISSLYKVNVSSLKCHKCLQFHKSQYIHIHVEPKLKYEIRVFHVHLFHIS